MLFDGAEVAATIQVEHPTEISEEAAMARLVKHEETGPYEIPEGTELPAWICGCGLSKNKPYCDGSHKKTRDEGAGLFTYDGDKRTPVTK